MRKFCLLTLIALLLLTVFFSLAETTLSNVTLFAPEKPSPQINGTEVYARCIIKMNDIIYAYLSNAKLYTWQGEETYPVFYCQLPPIPYATANDYTELDSITKAKWEQMVSVIAAGDDTIWGFNVYNGRVGRIDTDGVRWSEVSLDLELLWPQDARWPLRIVYSFVEGSKLYTYVAHDDGARPFNNYSLFEFSLENGVCREIDIRNAQAVCSYKQGKLLLLHNTDDSHWQINIIDLVTGTMSGSAFAPIAYEKIAPIGGMAFDAKNKRLLYTTHGQVLTEGKDENYAGVASAPVTSEVIDSTAFVLKDGRYALFANSLYVRAINESFQESNRLSIKGANDPRIYTDFMQDNPNTIVSFSGGMPSSDDIAQAMITGDESADLFAVFADNTFKAVVKKGYAASLADSTILSEDISNMYPNIQKVITDGSGIPIAYPYHIILRNWQLNDFLWTKVYGETPPPKTYEEFLNAMLLWEKNYAERYPNISFSGDFDHVVWIKTLINAYAQQYGLENQELSFKVPSLQNSLRKLELVCEERKVNGRATRILEDEQFVPKAEIFITMGGHNVLQDPDTLRPLESYEQHEGFVEEGVYREIPSLTFLEDEDSVVPGSMIVWFVNPFSPRKDISIRYLEYAAKKENNILTYYATHLGETDPVENQGYQQRLQELKNQIAILRKAVYNAAGAERSNFESSLKQAETMLKNLSKEQWMISANAIRIHQALAPSIRFFENNPYVLIENSRMLNQLESLFERYANANITLDMFLDELDDKMRLIYLEGE